MTFDIDPVGAEREVARLERGRLLADAYCRLHDAQRALERAQRVFEEKLLDASAADVLVARAELALSLEPEFVASVRTTLAARLTATAEKGKVTP